MTSPLPAAVFWDMDGTIVDTEPYWMTAEEDLVRSHGAEWTHDDALAVVGAALPTAAALFQRRGVQLSTDEIITTLTNRVADQIRVAVPWRPGARELLTELRDAGIPCALVTMSYPAMTDLVVDAIGFDAFDAVVTGDLVTRGKPHPDPYLHAARLLGIDPADALAIEDSPTGLQAAIASGMVTIGVPAHVELPDRDDYVQWHTLTDRTLTDLGQVFAERRRTNPSTSNHQNGGAA